MQVLRSAGGSIGRVVCFVPRWIPAELSLCGMPYKVFPVLSSLARHGLTVDLFTELHDDLDGAELRASLEGCDGAFAWCPEMNPGVQLPGAVRFLERARDLAPAAPRLAGGAFLYLIPERARSLPGLADQVVADAGVPSVAGFFRARLAESRGIPFEPSARPSSNAEQLDPLSLRELDLRPFAKPEGILFDNDAPTLQLPTGLGCAKRCAFCFYERSKVALMPGPAMASLMLELQQRYGIGQFLLGELDAFASRRRILAFADALIAGARTARLRWFALASIADLDGMSDEALERIARSGCHSLEIGTEVGSGEGLAAIGKRYDAPAAVRTSVRLQRAGIVPIHNIMLGYVGETRPQRHETLRQIARIRRTSPRSKFNFRIYQAVPNTTMGDAVLGGNGFPTTLLELGAWREAMLDGRAMPWLDIREERAVRELSDHWLPLAYDDPLAQQPSALRKLLRRVARFRCRTGMLGLPLDRWLFQRFETVGLPGTFLA